MGIMDDVASPYMKIGTKTNNIFVLGETNYEHIVQFLLNNFWC